MMKNKITYAVFIGNEYIGWFQVSKWKENFKSAQAIFDQKELGGYLVKKKIVQRVEMFSTVMEEINDTR